MEKTKAAEQEGRLDGLVGLTECQKKILDVLDLDGGYTTGRIAARVTPQFGNKRMHSGAVRSWLVLLERKGLVKKMDDQKPVCWMLNLRPNA